jgi:hypothetical protein
MQDVHLKTRQRVGDALPPKALDPEADCLDMALVAPARNVACSCSPGLARALPGLNVSVVFTSSRPGLLGFGSVDENSPVNAHQPVLPGPIGIGSDRAEDLLLAAGFQIIRFRNGIEPAEVAAHRFGRFFLPCGTRLAGGVDPRGVGTDAAGWPVLVSTSSDAFCRPGAGHCFEPIRRPVVLGKIADEDRQGLRCPAEISQGCPALLSSLAWIKTVEKNHGA